MDLLGAGPGEGPRIDVEVEPTDLEKLALAPAGRVGDGDAGIGKPTDQQVGVVVLDGEVGAGGLGQGGIDQTRGEPAEGPDRQEAGQEDEEHQTGEDGEELA